MKNKVELREGGTEHATQSSESAPPRVDASPRLSDLRGRRWGAGFCTVPANEQPVMDGCYYCGRPVVGLNGEHNHTEYEKGRYSYVCENC